jgi:hypothetical protein
MCRVQNLRDVKSKKLTGTIKINPQTEVFIFLHSHPVTYIKLGDVDVLRKVGIN